MANKRQRGIKAAAARELAAKKKANPDYRQNTPARLNRPKDWRRNSQQPGFRKNSYEIPGVAKAPVIKVYKDTVPA